MKRALTPWEWRDNYLRTIEFREPEWIIGKIHILMDAWHKYREEMERVVLKHKFVFPFYRKGMVNFDDFGIRRRGNVFTDPWGCKWMFNIDGLQGQVVEHPLSDWSRWREYSLPDPDEGIPQEGGPTIPWEVVEKAVERAREVGGLAEVGMPHGFFFQRLYYLRGFGNLLRDFVLKPPQIYELIEELTRYNLELVERLLKFPGVDVVSFGDDLGCQDRLPISPQTFREFIYPAYKKIFGRVRSAGARVRLHSDGRVIEIAGDLVQAGVSILNIQDRVNGLLNIRRALFGKVCVELDIDRQRLIPFGRPEEIRSYVKRVVSLLGSPRGGLMLYAEVHPPTPLENIRALAEALQENVWLKR